MASDRVDLQTVSLHRDAPAKPRIGLNCNGCGLCCAAEPCPVGLVVFRQRSGPCPALIWDQAAGRYWCDMVRNPARHLSWLPKSWAMALAPLFSRWISADLACDSDAELIDET